MRYSRPDGTGIVVDADWPITIRRPDIAVVVVNGPSDVWRTFPTPSIDELRKFFNYPKLGKYDLPVSELLSRWQRWLRAALL